jgi:hypothetical protein
VGGRPGTPGPVGGPAHTIDQNVIQKRKRGDESTSSDSLAIGTIADGSSTSSADITLAVNLSEEEEGIVGTEMMKAAIISACRQAVVEGPAASVAVLKRYRSSLNKSLTASLELVGSLDQAEMYSVRQYCQQGGVGCFVQPNLQPVVRGHGSRVSV